MTELNLAEIQFANPRIRGEVEVAIKAEKDDAFKQSLLSNPKTTLEQEFKTQFPDDLTIKVVEAQPHYFYLRLPAKPEVADTLSMEELVQGLISTEGEMALLIAKVFKDPDFKQALLSNPKVTLAQELGVELPENLVVEVLEETINTLIVLLPPNVTQAELSDEELESVTGGTMIVLASICRAILPTVGRSAAEDLAIAGGKATAGNAGLVAAELAGRAIGGARVLGVGTAATTVVVAGGTAGANQVYSFW